MTDYNFLMESRLSTEQSRVLNHISRMGSEQGLNLYLVGGAVRDLTSGQFSVRDLDFVVEGNPQKLLRHLSPPRQGKIRRSESHVASPGPPPLELEYLSFDSELQAADFMFTNGVRGEIAMSRNEIYSKPGRRPAILPATIFEDLKRRDFSVNAMAVSLHPNSRGLLLDPTNGGADVENHELRVMHSRSFAEDPSRIYRLLRLRSRLDYKPAERTKQYLDSALENQLFERMSTEQQGHELQAILEEENPGRILRTLADHGLLAGLDRKLARTRVPYDCLTKVRAAVRTIPGAEPLLLNFHCLVERLPGGQRKRLAGIIIPYKAAINLVFSLERDAKKLARVLGSSKAALPSQVYALLSGHPLPLLLFLLVHYRQAKVQNRVKNFLLKYPHVRANLPRAELEALGMKPGPKFEKIIERIFVAQLDGKIKTHQQLIKEMRALSGIKEPPKPVKPVKPVKPAKGAKTAAAAPVAAKQAAKTAKPAEHAKHAPAAVPPLQPASPVHEVKRLAPPKPVKPGKPVKPARPRAFKKPGKKK